VEVDWATATLIREDTSTAT